MHGVQPRSLTNRELIRHCANKLELTLTRSDGLTYEEQIELLRRFVMLVDKHQEGERLRDNRTSTYNSEPDPEAD